MYFTVQHTAPSNFGLNHSTEIQVCARFNKNITQVPVPLPHWLKNVQHCEMQFAWTVSHRHITCLNLLENMSAHFIRSNMLKQDPPFIFIGKVLVSLSNITILYIYFGEWKEFLSWIDVGFCRRMLFKCIIPSSFFWEEARNDGWASLSRIFTPNFPAIPFCFIFYNSTYFALQLWSD